MWLVLPAGERRHPGPFGPGKSTVHSVLYRRFFGIMRELGRWLSWFRSRMYTSDMT